MNSDIPQPPPSVMPGAAEIEAAYAEHDAETVFAATRGPAAPEAPGPLLSDRTIEQQADPATRNFASGTGPAPVRKAPVLLHSGHYALYLTPAGRYHLTYQREASTHPDTGEVTAVLDSPEVHFRDLPEHAATMVLAVLDRDQELPPMLQQFLLGGANPLAGGKAAMVRQMAALAGEAGGLDQLLEFAQRNGNGGPADGTAVE